MNILYEYTMSTHIIAYLKRAICVIGVLGEKEMIPSVSSFLLKLSEPTTDVWRFTGNTVKIFNELFPLVDSSRVNSCDNLLGTPSLYVRNNCVIHVNPSKRTSGRST